MQQVRCVSSSLLLTLLPLILPCSLYKLGALLYNHFQEQTIRSFIACCVVGMLCRWTSAGAFYPFSRNHMMISHLSRSHEPYRWPAVAAAHAKAYRMRYQLLGYMYSSLARAHTVGGSFARPLFFTQPGNAGVRCGSAAVCDGVWCSGLKEAEC